MARIKFISLLGIFGALALFQGARGSPRSIELLIPLLLNTTTGGSNQSSTDSSISGRIQASLNNVLRIPLPLWGTSGPINSSQLSLLSSLPHHGVVAAVVQPLNAIGDSINLRQQNQAQQGSANSQGAPPTSFLPDVIPAIHSTIAQLSVLSHWPFPYETTVRSQFSESEAPTTVKPPPPPTTTPTATTRAPATTTTTTRRTTTTLATTQPPPPPPAPTQALPPPPPPLPPYVLPSPVQSQPTTRPLSPSLPDRIHNRIQSTLGNFRLPTLSHLGPRPRPQLTEPPWVTELLGPTLEPPTTRAPTLGERVHNAVSNVVLFVPATLLNFWYENWGTQHVDRVISRLQVATPKPGSPPADPLFATISQNHPGNPFANFTADRFSNPADLPTIAAFINSNGKLTPTIVHPVVNMTSNTIEYLLRNENETTVLWTGSLSNDVFFGNKKRTQELLIDMEDDEDEHIKNYALNINL